MAHAARAMGVALYDADPAGALEELEHAMSYAGAVALAARGELEAAAVALGAEERASLKLPVREAERERHRGVVERVRTALGDDVYREMTARGAALTPEQLVAELREAATAAADGDADARASRDI